MTGGSERPAGRDLSATTASTASRASGCPPAKSAPNATLSGTKRTEAVEAGSTTVPAARDRAQTAALASLGVTGSTPADWVARFERTAEEVRARKIERLKAELEEWEAASPAQVLGMAMHARLDEEENDALRRERDTDKSKVIRDLDAQLDWRREHDAERVAGGNKRGAAQRHWREVNERLAAAALKEVIALGCNKSEAAKTAHPRYLAAARAADAPEWSLWKSWQTLRKYAGATGG